MCLQLDDLSTVWYWRSWSLMCGAAVWLGQSFVSVSGSVFMILSLPRWFPTRVLVHQRALLQILVYTRKHWMVKWDWRMRLNIHYFNHFSHFAVKNDEYRVQWKLNNNNMDGWYLSQILSSWCFDDDFSDIYITFIQSLRMNWCFSSILMYM